MVSTIHLTLRGAMSDIRCMAACWLQCAGTARVESLPGVVQAGVMKALVACLGQVTAAVDPGQWPGAVRPFGLLLQLLLDERPKVRKRAQDAAQAVLVGLQGTSARQPASEAVLKSALL